MYKLPKKKPTDRPASAYEIKKRQQETLRRIDEVKDLATSEATLFVQKLMFVALHRCYGTSSAGMAKLLIEQERVSQEIIAKTLDLDEECRRLGIDFDELPKMERPKSKCGECIHSKVCRKYDVVKDDGQAKCNDFERGNE